MIARETASIGCGVPGTPFGSGLRLATEFTVHEESAAWQAGIDEIRSELVQEVLIPSFFEVGYVESVTSLARLSVPATGRPTAGCPAVTPGDRRIFTVPPTDRRGGTT
ncbi:hypothetical protein GCM10010218_33030 [Streptomyces mashuensis]|uniref:Uncharacterized protein n=1 Tax=Streptomyces mashuensis TaxID=33904 RepID=A0A919B4N6_9ACTN|nr:hypothetical protein GCM10010218_33030 [Streptomyces mashuensis]